MNTEQLKQADFERRLRESHKYVRMVDRQFKSNGWRTFMPASTCCDSKDNWKAHKDDGDLFVTASPECAENPIWHRIEVKRVTHNFNNVRTFKYPELIICAAHSFDFAEWKPHSFIILSADCKTAAVAVSSRKSEWSRREIVDRKRSAATGSRSAQICYVVNKGRIQFVPINRIGA